MRLDKLPAIASQSPAHAQTASITSASAPSLDVAFITQPKLLSVVKLRTNIHKWRKSSQVSREEQEQLVGHMGKFNRAHHNKSKYVKMYRAKKVQWDMERVQAQLDAKRRLEAEKLADANSRMKGVGFKQKTVSPVKLVQFFDGEGRNALFPPLKSGVKPVEHWPASRYKMATCAKTGLPALPGWRKECMFCPVVIRFTSEDTKASRQNFVCPHCRDDIQLNRQEVNFDRETRAVFQKRQRAILLLQTHVRAYLPRARFRKVRKGATLLSSRIRGRIARKKFNQTFRSKERPFRIRVVSADGLRAADADGKSDPLVHVNVVSSKSGLHQFHFQSKVRKATLRPHWDQNFLVPGANGSVNIAFTVIDFDELRNDFLGQAVLELEGTDVWRKGGHFTLPLTPMTVQPTENRVAMRLGEMDIEEVTGRIKVAVEVLSVFNSHCGWLQQKEPKEAPHESELLPTDTTKRRWWAVLAEGSLMLFRYNNEQRVQHEFLLDKGSTVTCSRVQHGSMEIKSKRRQPFVVGLQGAIVTAKTSSNSQSVQNWFFAAENDRETKAWYKRIKNVFQGLESPSQTEAAAVDA